MHICALRHAEVSRKSTPRDVLKMWNVASQRRSGPHRKRLIGPLIRTFLDRDKILVQAPSGPLHSWLCRDREVAPHMNTRPVSYFIVETVERMRIYRFRVAWSIHGIIWRGRGTWPIRICTRGAWRKTRVDTLKPGIEIVEGPVCAAARFTAVVCDASNVILHGADPQRSQRDQT